MSALETRITGTFRTRFLLELFRNSGQFAIANILLEVLLEGPAEYLLKPDLYILALAALIQTYWLTRWRATSRPRRFLGNLMAPALYTVIESALEGLRFFSAPHHLAYWVIAIIIGALQELRWHQSDRLSGAIIIAENMTRASILFVMYVVLEFSSKTAGNYTLAIFFGEATHQFFALATLLFGLGIGVADLVAKRYLDLLQITSKQLKRYSEWLLGRDLLGRAIDDPASLSLDRRDRAVLFMDIRGFTIWSEPKPPEEVVSMLNRYYAETEAILTRHRVIKFKFTGDEVMAVYRTIDDAAAAALALRSKIRQLLSEDNLGAGIGLHAGPLVEGLLGGRDVKYYDVIGDTVNTGKRIESATLAAQILISESAVSLLSNKPVLSNEIEITAKGKAAPLKVFLLESLAVDA